MEGGDDSYYYSHQPNGGYYDGGGGSNSNGDGWVPAPMTTDHGGRSRKKRPNYHQHAINANVARLRTAEALLLVGDVMVQCSKEGTAWIE